jgi:hypothetical protein
VEARTVRVDKDASNRNDKTTLVLAMPPDVAERLLAAFKDGSLAQIGIKNVTNITAEKRARPWADAESTRTTRNHQPDDESPSR